MPAVLRQGQWQGRKLRYGDDHPATRAAFGRYVGARQGTLTVSSSGREAAVAQMREAGVAGYSNRGYRKALHRLLRSGKSLGWLLDLRA
jgi:hypothetical protein